MSGQTLGQREVSNYARNMADCERHRVVGSTSPRQQLQHHGKVKNADGKALQSPKSRRDGVRRSVAETAGYGAYNSLDSAAGISISNSEQRKDDMLMHTSV